jgi:bifunctional non-homologous end joining protein LigD
MYVPLNTPGVTHEGAATFALAVGQVLERDAGRVGQTGYQTGSPADVRQGAQPAVGVTTVMAKSARPGKVFIDWSQNALHKTTIAPYSLRARHDPTVSTPVSWDEVSDCASGDLELRFEAGDVLQRVGEFGDLFKPVLEVEQELPTPS